MHSSEISNIAFSATKLREGYSRDEVDTFLDAVRQTLQRWEAGSAGELTSQSVEESRFTPTKFRSGYDQGEVDDFLDEVSATMSGYEAGLHP
jgi:DivIVA domain-containing protein